MLEQIFNSMMLDHGRHFAEPTKLELKTEVAYARSRYLREMFPSKNYGEPEYTSHCNAWQQEYFEHSEAMLALITEMGRKKCSR